MNDNTTTNANASKALQGQGQAAATGLSGAIGSAALPASGAASSSANAADSSASSLQAQRVHDGRLSAAMRENNELKARLTQLEALVAQQRESAAASSAAPAPGGAPAEGGDEDDGEDSKILDEFDEETRATISKYVDARLRRQTAKMGERIGRMERREADAELSATMQKAGAQVEAQWPGLCARVSDGGDLTDAWRRFNAAPDPIVGGTYYQSLSASAARGSVEGVLRVFAQFVDQGGLSGQFGSAAPGAPRALPSTGASTLSGASTFEGAVSLGLSQGQGKVWPSAAAIEQEMKRIVRLERDGRIDRKTRDSHLALLEDAMTHRRYLS